MSKRLSSGIVLILLLANLLASAVHIHPVKAQGTIYIRADGSIDPPTAPISTVDNVTYTFTDNIYDQINVLRNNIIIDGNGHVLQGPGNGTGLGLYCAAYTKNVTIRNMNIRDWNVGIWFEAASNNNIVIWNNITNNSGNGIDLGSATYNTYNSISENNITNNSGDGIRGGACSNISRNNISSNNFYGIRTSGQNNSISENDIAANGLEGIWLANSSGSTLFGNNISSNQDGIFLSASSHNNSIVGNSVTANSYGGIYFTSCFNNSVSGNTLEGNGYYGIIISACSDNKIGENNITANTYYGVHLVSNSSSNTFFHNNFNSNPYQVWSNDNLTNYWDDGYPSGGNYWSNYNGTDLYSGVYQNETGSDGIGDTAYVARAGNIDHYPLVNPWITSAAENETYVRYSWPMFHHDSQHSGYSWSPAPNTNKILWTYTMGSQVYFCSPAVADGRIYVGSNGRTIYCLDAHDGTTIWYYTTDGLIWSSPAVADGKVYVGSMDNKTYCLDALTGASIWNYTTGRGVWSSPVVADGKVYFGSRDNKTYCLDASTGVHIWNYTTGNAVCSSPAVVGGRVYFGSFDNKTYCLNASTGTHIWNFTTGGVVFSSPAVADGRVYFGSEDNRTYCLDALTGASIWSFTTGNLVESSPAVAGGRVYFGSRDSKVYCLDALTGASIWSFTAPAPVDSSPAIADGKVYIGSTGIQCLDVLTGASIWNGSGTTMLSSPAVADGVVYIVSWSGIVYAFGNVTRVPEDYPTIQAAIDAVDPGNTIWIAPGTYSESLVINKTIAIIGLIGSSPIFSGGGSGTAITLLPGASGSIIAGIVITDWDRGILVAGVADCKIYDNIMSSIKKNGIVVEGNNAVNNLIYSNIFEKNAVAINITSSSATNTIYKNIVTSNTVGLKLESGGNIVYANSIAQNELGINVSSSGNTLYHNDFIDNTAKLYISPSKTNTWNDDYPSGGNYWGECPWVDKFRGPDQKDAGSDGVNDTAYMIDQNNVDNYPLLQPFSRHDIGITQVLTSKTVVAQGLTLDIDVKVLNYGVYDETFTVTLYADTTVIGVQVAAVATRSSLVVTFAWSTVGVAKADYTVSAVVDMLPDETDQLDNTLADGTVTVSIPGDVTGDVWVDMQDISLLIEKFMTTSNDPKWDPNCDINSDLSVDMADIQLAIDHFMQP